MAKLSRRVCIFFTYFWMAFLFVNMVFQAEACTDEVFAQVTLLPEAKVRYCDVYILTN